MTLDLSYFDRSSSVIFKPSYQYLRNAAELRHYTFNAMQCILPVLLHFTLSTNIDVKYDVTHMIWH